MIDSLLLGAAILADNLDQPVLYLYMFRIVYFMYSCTLVTVLSIIRVAYLYHVPFVTLLIIFIYFSNEFSILAVELCNTVLFYDR